MYPKMFDKTLGGQHYSLTKNELPNICITDMKLIAHLEIFC
ncbi:hypothetical protein RVIR1_09100 [Candidatus Rickettsiella viridis]|uniref:Uncharacterized protein n=1 Tax=Candidatus Rickettsiella viridis TaxID=676208 RepID=A0A2Z5UWS5_9COXI|nr:hypothetical protein RVIR1_09100 [Candidatus Rickettsiella viridis]